MLRYVLAALLFAGAVTSVTSAPVDHKCPEHFYKGQAPTATVDTELCRQVFAVGYSYVNRVPVWSAEHLTDARVDSASGLTRVNAFHAETGLPVSALAELYDYARSSYDRGHMTPCGDAPDASAAHETFSLANMVPQAPSLNRGIWERYETEARVMAKTQGDIYIVTGPILLDTNHTRLNGRVRIPTYVYKAVLDPASDSASAVVCVNDNSQTCESTTVASLEVRLGYKLFPGGYKEGLCYPLSGSK